MGVPAFTHVCTKYTSVYTQEHIETALDPAVPKCSAVYCMMYVQSNCSRCSRHRCQPRWVCPRCTYVASHEDGHRQDHSPLGWQRQSQSSRPADHMHHMNNVIGITHTNMDMPALALHHSSYYYTTLDSAPHIENIINLTSTKSYKK